MVQGYWKKEDRDARMYFYYDVILGLVYYSEPYYSYEEAELECLKKLIEILKEIR